MWVSATKESTDVIVGDSESAKWGAGATWLEQQKQSSSAEGLPRLPPVGCVALTDGMFGALEETLLGVSNWLSTAHKFGTQMSIAAHERIRIAASLCQLANMLFNNTVLP